MKSFIDEVSFHIIQGSIVFIVILQVGRVGGVDVCRSDESTNIKFKFWYNVPKRSSIGSKPICNFQRFEVCESIL